jgi:intracellular septation protein
MFSKRLFINAFCEFGPVLGFLVAFKVKNFSAGIITMMIATTISLFVLKYLENHIPIFALISSGSVLFFGGLSLVIDIPSIFILRDTLFDGIFGTTILISVYFKKPIFKYIFRGVFSITPKGWSTLSLRWGIFFLILAFANEWVRLNLSPEDWVKAKVIIIIASIIFGTYQLTLTKKERLPEATAWGVIA